MSRIKWFLDVELRYRRPNYREHPPSKGDASRLTNLSNTLTIVTRNLGHVHLLNIIVTYYCPADEAPRNRAHLTSRHDESFRKIIQIPFKDSRYSPSKSRHFSSVYLLPFADWTGTLPTVSRRYQLSLLIIIS